jgi:hypothetical protein
MKFHYFLDLIISGAFGLFAFLFYLLNKDEVKRRREEEMSEAFTRAGSFKSWMIIIFSIIFCLVYFFSFVNSIVT